MTAMRIGKVATLAVAAVVWTYWRRRDPVLSVALFVTATFLVTPYAFNYDMVVFGWVIALLLQRTDNEPLDHYLYFALWVLPVLVVGATAVLILARRRRRP